MGKAKQWWEKLNIDVNTKILTINDSILSLGIFPIIFQYSI